MSNDFDLLSILVSYNIVNSINLDLVGDCMTLLVMQMHGTKHCWPNDDSNWKEGGRDALNRTPIRGVPDAILTLSLRAFNLMQPKHVSKNLNQL